MEFMTAGAPFCEPREGNIRITVSPLRHYLPRDPRANDLGEVDVLGLMVQEYGPRQDSEGFELCGGGQWDDMCPLVDFPEQYPHMICDLPSIKWTHRSRQFFSEFKLCLFPMLQLVGAAP